MSSNVQTVLCPECGRKWTGEFKGTPPDEAICRDCIKENNIKTDDHRDVDINPSQR